MTIDRSVDSRVAKPPVETLVFGEPRSAYAAVLAEFFSILRDVRRSPKSRTLFVLAGCLLVVLVLNMLGQVYLNRWQGQFYRAIERRSLADIWSELQVFAAVVILLLGVVVCQTFFHERLKIGVREWMSNHLLDQWLVPGRAYRLALSSDEAVNPDQRIQEDTRNFSEMTTDLGVGLVGASMLLVSFIGVLWVMSQNVHFTYDGHVFSVPGYMVWVAIAYAALGSYVTARVGRPLITLNESRYANEANLRFSVVRVSESSESVAFYKGEVDERRIIQHALDRVVATMRQVSVALARLTWITQGYGFVMIVLPVLVALPGYLQGSLDLGGLMMVVGAFNQVQGALRWFVDNFARIAEWRAALHRVVVFRDAVNLVDQYEGDDSQIQLLDHPEGHLSFEGTKISLIDGEVVIADATAVVRPGERVLITGESGTGKSTLFRAVGGLWPWGSGLIRLPPHDQIMFLPQKPYMPLGTLADALCYPHVAAKRDHERMKQALTRVNLEEFVPMLDESERWDKLMSLGQQQRLAFARVYMHRPKWVFLDEATSALDDKNQDVVMSLFTSELEGTTILSIGHRHGLGDYHTRTLHLTTEQSGVVLRRRPRLERRPLWAKALSYLGRKE